LFSSPEAVEPELLKSLNSISFDEINRSVIFDRQVLVGAVLKKQLYHADLRNKRNNQKLL
jgi:hypothetical protein